MEIVLYSTGCPKCSVLKKKLDEKNVEYTVETDENKMSKLGITVVPVLSVDGAYLSFTSAVQWLKEYYEG